ncbi:hypothetical protein ACOMHN_044262 [Nucella lapillus]
MSSPRVKNAPQEFPPVVPPAEQAPPAVAASKGEEAGTSVKGATPSPEAAVATVAELAKTPSPEPAQAIGDSQGKSINLVLRLRNEKRELNDIRFDFKPGHDTPDSVSRELVEAGLVSGRDMIVVAANLQKILDSADSKAITFALNSGCGPNEAADDKNLVGFAQLSLTSEEGKNS